MPVAERLKEHRERENLTQTQMANLINVSRSTYGAYERGTRTIPDDVIAKAVNEFENPEILAEFAYDRGTEFFNVPVLDNVDKHPLVVIDVLIEEASEMIKALMQIRRAIKNKHSADQIKKEDFKVLMEHEEQVGDVYAALKMHFVTMSKFGVNVKDVERMCIRKLINKHFIKKEKARLIWRAKIIIYYKYIISIILYQH